MRPAFPPPPRPKRSKKFLRSIAHEPFRHAGKSALAPVPRRRERDRRRRRCGDGATSSPRARMKAPGHRRAAPQRGVAFLAQEFRHQNGRRREYFRHRVRQRAVAQDIPARCAAHDRRAHGKDHLADAALADRVAAEGAGLHVRVDGAVGQIGAAERLLRLANRHQFGMAGDVALMRDPVGGLGHDDRRCAR